MMKRKKKIFKAYINLLLMGGSIITFILLSYILILYKSFATIYRILGILIILYLYILLFYNLLNSIKRKKEKAFFILIILIIMLNIIDISGFYYLNKIYKTFNNYSNTTNTYSTSLITYDLDLKDHNDLNNNKIGIIKTNNEIPDIAGNILPLEIIKDLKLEANNKIIYYDSTIDLLYALKENEIKAAFFSSNYIEMFSSLEKFENIENETKSLYTISKEYETNEETYNKSNLNTPFNMLLIGVDSSKDGVTSGYNADVLLLISFNPKTLSATFTSLPRDIYLQTACSNGKFRRINTTTWGSSSSCAVETVENLFNTNIDYYAKINFKGIVDLVDSLGGIDVNVDYSFCEQNSSRKWADNTIYVKEGNQHLNGEQALAFSRNRHKPNDGSASGKQMAKYCPTYNDGIRNDYVRGKNQMKVIMGIITSASKLKDPNQAIEIMEKISKNFQTNIQTKDVLSLYNLGKSLIISDATNLININRLQLSGKNMYGKIYEQSSKSYPSITIPYQESIEYITNEINSSLGLSQSQLIKTISFDLKNINKDNNTNANNYSIINITTLDDLSNMSYDEIKKYTEDNNLKLNIVDYDTNQKLNISDFSQYYFYKQKEHKDIIIEELENITIYVKKRSITN